MASATLVPVSEYLSTSYRPDREYVDGVVLKRNLGEREHSTIQGELIYLLRGRSKELHIWVYPEQRVQVKPTRFRVPDICVMLGSRPKEPIFTQPPFLGIEILSKDDRMSEMQDRISDYLAFGVRYVWLIDPLKRRAWIYTADASHEAKDGILRAENPGIALPLADIFAAL